MKPIIEELTDYGFTLSNGEQIADIRVGLGYTAVQLTSGKAGVAATLRYLVGKGPCTLLQEAGTLVGMSAKQAITLFQSHNVVEASIGLATLNALIDFTEGLHASDNELIDLLHITRNDTVGMVGDIGPVVNIIRQHTDSCIVFDEGKSGEEGITDTARQSEVLPQCGVIILSATSLLNKTFDHLLSFASGAREICLMGPSTPLVPDIFRARGITLLAGRRITDASQLLRIVSEAGGTKCFREVTEKVDIVLKQENPRN